MLEQVHRQLPGCRAQSVMMKHLRPMPQIALAAAPTQAESLQMPQISTRGEKPLAGLRFKTSGKEEDPPQSGGAARLMVVEKSASTGRVAGAGAAVSAAAGAPAAFARDPKHSNAKANSKAALVFI